MKLLTIAVPCYNSAAYMKNCIDTMLVGGDAVEILIVDDGSTDDTARIADEILRSHPGTVRVIHQSNRGHGGAVMTALENATGQYFKVVDSDDWVDMAAYQKILDTLRTLGQAPDSVDLLVSNYIYDKVGVRRKHAVRYANVLPQGRIFGWNDVGRFRMGQYILMHSTIYRTELLRSCGLRLPEHTFYVDNLYVYVPMRQVRRLYYLDVDFYHYFIGREDQSVQEATMIRRIDQQIRVNRMMMEALDLEGVENVRQRNYLFHYLEIVTTVSSILLLKAGDGESLEKMRELWAFLQDQDAVVYRKLRRGLFGRMLHLPGRAGRAVPVAAYRLTQKIFGFN